MALDIGAGDEVITTPYSFFATAGAIARLGARPVFVDIDPRRFNIDRGVPERITSRTKAIMPVHLFGRCADMDADARDRRDGTAFRSSRMRRRRIGAHDHRGRHAGSIGAIGLLLVFPQQEPRRVRRRRHGRHERRRRWPSASHSARARQRSRSTYHRIVGGNFRLDALQAAVLRVKLQHLPAWAQARRRNAATYRRMFQPMRGMAEFICAAGGFARPRLQSVRHSGEGSRWAADLPSHAHGGTEVYYPVPLHLQECFSELGHKPGEFAHSEAAARETLAIPVYPELTDEQQRYVVRSIADYYRR